MSKRARRTFFISDEIYAWMKDDATQKGFEDFMGRYVEMLVKEVQECRAHHSNKP